MWSSHSDSMAISRDMGPLGQRASSPVFLTAIGRVQGGYPQRGMERLTEVKNRVNPRYFQGVFRLSQGVLRVFSGCFSLSPLRVSVFNPSKATRFVQSWRSGNLKLSRKNFRASLRTAFSGADAQTAILVSTAKVWISAPDT